MCLRFLMYIAKIYETMNERRTLYSTKLIPIPQPEFFVLYNGLAPCPDEQIMKLSDAFMDMGKLWLAERQDPALELIVRVLNINDGRNAKLLSSCKALGEYSAFVARERFFEQQLGDRQKAMQKAVRYCMDHDILTKFMEKHSREVLSMRMPSATAFHRVEYRRSYSRLARGRQRGRIGRRHRPGIRTGARGRPR